MEQPKYKTESQLTEEDKASGRYVRMNRAQRRQYMRQMNSIRKQNAKKTRQKIKEITELIGETAGQPDTSREAIREGEAGEQRVFGKRSIP